MRYPSSKITTKMRVARAGAALVLAGLAAACAPQGGQAPRAAIPVTVESVAASPLAVEQIVTGAVEAHAETPLAFLVSGQITALAVDVGARVRKGDVVARLSDTEQRADVAAAEAGLSAAELQVTLAKATLDRQQTLIGQGLTTQAAFDAARTQHEAARNSRDSAQAQLNLARETLGYTELKASADGIITRRNFEVDEVTQAGAPVFVLAEDGPRKVAINLDEIAIAEWPRDRDVSVSLIGDPKVTARGRLTEVAPILDATGTVEAKIALDPEAALPLGASVSVMLAWPEEQVIALPAQALWETAGKPAVWTVAEDGTVATVPVEIGSFGTDRVVVASGLTVGQRVVVNGTQFLAPGAKVSFDEVTK